jgi:hypothetical protein
MIGQKLSGKQTGREGRRMPVEVEIRGTESLTLISKRLKQLGDGNEIPKQMTKEIRSAVPPIRVAVRRNAVGTLPSGGGLGEWVARSRVTAAIRRSGRSAGIKLRAGRNSEKKRSDIRAIDKGRVRAPLFGNRSKWHLQSVKPGFFTDAVTDEGMEAFRKAVVKAIDKAVREVLGRG